MIKFSYKLSYSQRLQLPLKKLTWLHISKIVIELYVLYVLNTYQILYQLDIIYYSIHKLTFNT